ncbi:Iron-dependent repressor IdeR [Salinivirga cyanobacteriivorans]|uniref:Transcriptional regulator MntR n=1 Tax=Salinivirga cyanobacteriivorans TaxID=1307839 RepID=A0A0S2HZE3_9BACT|nr:metal-dependent transcriptional regulator [Salinivirga cyanobacteriivorans]ALO15513.1 Iron-dependent repressor IdeR [Salinivirga cyanobacteriivorans]
MSISTENFVKAIYKQTQVSGGDTKPGTLAKLLSITNAATTDMARKLAAKKLVNYTKYKELTLTTEGEKMALNVLRKHRLWETFLHKTLNLSLHEIHREAEMLEHLTSDFLAEKISNYVGNPEYDPHGDPIPNMHGIITDRHNTILLSQAREHTDYKITRLFSSDEDFFNFCKENNLMIGMDVRVVKQYESNKMTEIAVNNKHVLLNADFTNVIYVKPVLT